MSKITKAEIKRKIKQEIKKGCSACNSIGMWHCANPNECGNWTELHKLEKLLTK